MHREVLHRPKHEIELCLLVSLIIRQYLVPLNVHPNFCTLEHSTFNQSAQIFFLVKSFVVSSLFCSSCWSIKLNHLIGSFFFLPPPCFAFTCQSYDLQDLYIDFIEHTIPSSFIKSFRICVNNEPSLFKLITRRCANRLSLTIFLE